MKNKIADLRDHLFATLEALNDPEKPMELERAKTICTVAQTIIGTAKAETDRLAVIGEFLGAQPTDGFITTALPAVNASPQKPAAQIGHKQN